MISQKSSNNQTSNKPSHWTNSFTLDVNLDVQIYQLSLKVTPQLPKDKSFLLSKLVQLALPNLEKLLSKGYSVTGNTVFSLKPLTEESPSLSDTDGHHLSICTTGVDFLLADVFKTSRSPEILRFLNVILKNYMEANSFQEFGHHSSYYPTNEKPREVYDTLKVLPGFKITIDKYLDQTLKINIDTCFRISAKYSIYEELHYYVENSNIRGGPEVARNKFIDENIIGKSFTIQNNFKEMVKINGVCFNKRLNSPSPVDGYKTMKEYLEHKFSVKLAIQDQFFLYSESKKRGPKIIVGDEVKQETTKTYYPSELLFAIGMKKEDKNNFNIMRELAEHTKLEPHLRIKTIETFLGKFKSINDQIKMKVAEKRGNLLTPTILSAPSVKVRDNKTVSPKDGILFFKNKIYSKGSIKDWGVIYEGRENYMTRFLQEMSEEADNLGVSMDEPICFFADRPTITVYKDLMKKLAKEKKVKMILLIISKATGQYLYKDIKKYADTELQILTQCTIENEKTLTKRGFMNKITSQMCNKLGFPLWVVDRPKNFALGKRVMILGADVYHQRGRASVAALIGTTNADFSTYCSLSSVQPDRGQEIMNNITELVVEAIEEYQAKNKCLPELLVYYRDGVGETMLDLITEQEINELKKKLTEKFKEQAPKLTFIVVTKRISKKIIDLTHTGKDMDARNPASGTIVQSTIVKEANEFFMVAQKVTQGTATPTRYQVILNDCGVPLESLISLTYFQAFNYYGWTGAVKVPAVCQYAHKLAYHVGENYRQSNNFMKHNLYYL